jgi:hypothetical protein
MFLSQNYDEVGRPSTEEFKNKIQCLVFVTPGSRLPVRLVMEGGAM